MNTRRNKSKTFTYLYYGILVILSGVILILLNIGILSPVLRHLVFAWPMILVVIGIQQLFTRKYAPGLILLVIGIYFISPNIINAFPEFFGGLNPNFVQNFWPLLLIILGLTIVFGAFKKPRKGDSPYVKYSDEYSGSKENIGGSFDKNVVFSGGEYIVLDPVFSGGELNAVFGGIELDLRKTSLGEGDTFLEINAVFGGITITVPEDWYVEINLTCVLGGFSDERKSKGQYIPGRKLIITGACIFGGGEIKN